MTSDFSEGVPKRDAVEPREPDDVDDEVERVLPTLARPSSEDVVFAIAAHWGGAFASVIAPLCLYLVQTNRRSLGAWHSREAFNFQLTLLLFYFLTLVPLGLAVLDLWVMWFGVVVDLWLVIVPIALLVLVTVFEIVVIIIATVAAVQGRFFRCPLTIPFMRRPQLYAEPHDE